MAAGFCAEVPDLSLTCDDLRVSGSHALFAWTFAGHNAKSGHPLRVRGWEERDLDENLRVKTSRDWFDAEEYERQASGQ